MTAALPISQAVRVERRKTQGDVVLVCEHASNAFPAPFYDTLGLSPAQQSAHIAWDPGALGLARALSRVMKAPLVRACASRLIYDLNRPPHAPGAMPPQSEVHRIPGNQDLSPEERARRTRDLYLPFHRRLSEEIAMRLARGDLCALITVHSFTPVFHGQPRRTELGIIHDADDRFARLLEGHARRQTGLRVRMNDPYSAADGVAHTLALHATPMGLPHAMLEIRNDLIADGPAQVAMAARLAPALHAALTDWKEATCPAG